MLTWRSAMGIGHPEIDNANKQLIARINTFEKALAAQGQRAAAGIFLIGLYEQTAINFGREDKVQRECAFPFQEAHAREHATLLRTIEELHARYAAMSERDDHAPLVRELAALIKDWVARHIVQSDAKVKPYWLRKNNIFTKAGWG